MILNSIFEQVSYPNVVALGTSLLLAWLVVTAIYRLWFHPLAKFPGPFWAKLTVFPSWWHTRNQDRHIWLHRLQEQYGPEFRFSPDTVLINTPTAYRTIFGPKGNVKKSNYYKLWPRNEETINTWSSTELHTHARKRRVLNQAFSDKAMRSAEGFIHANTDRWIQLLGEKCGKDGWTESLNMADWINYLVFDILGDLCFGKCFDMKEPDSKLRHVPEMMLSFLELLHPIGFSPMGSLYIWLKPRGLDALMMLVAPPAIKNWQRFVEDCLEKRTKVEQELERNPKPESEVRKDFFYWLFRAVDPETGERGYSLNELYAECELLTIAGSDTTAIVMSAMFFYLARFPEVQAKLAKEVLSAYSSLEEIKGDPKLHSLKYLTAFIQEASRMTPPVSAEPSREVLAGGTRVDGHYIPAGLRVSTGLYCLSYNDHIYPEPFRFRPERWIVSEDEKEGSPAESVALAESGFCAFSTGSRGCVGKNLAWLEMRIVMAKVIFSFEMKADPTNKLGGGDPNGRAGRRVEDQYQTYEMFVSGRHGPMVHLKKRAH